MMTVVTWILGLSMLAGLGLIFSQWTATSWISFPWFLAAIGILFLIPGRLMIRLLQLRGAFLELLLLATVLGAVTTSVCFVAASWAGMPMLTWLWVGVAAVALLLEFRPLWAAGAVLRHAPNASHVLLLCALATVYVIPAVAPYCWPNLSLLSSGKLTYVDLPDLVLHASIASELTHSMPPQVPFSAGQPLFYHMGMDVVEALLCRVGGLSMMDLSTRFFPTFFLTIAVLAPFCFARRLLGSGIAAVVAAFLVVYGEDLAFLPGLLHHGTNAPWCAQFLAAPTVFSLCCVNPMLVAVGLLFTCLLCLSRSLREPGVGWAIALALCAAALFETKLFTFLHLALAVGLASLVCVPRVRAVLMFREMLCLGLVGVPLVALMAWANHGGVQFIWKYAPGLEGYVRAGFRAMHWPWLAKWALVGLPVYLAMVFGVRILALGEFATLVRRPPRENVMGWVLLMFVLIGPVISLTSAIIPRDADRYYNNAIWFMVQSKYVAWIPAVSVLLLFWVRWRTALPRLTLVVLVAAGSLPSTVQFLVWVRENTPRVELDSASAGALEFLRREAKAGDVVFSQLDGPLLCTTALRVPYHPMFTSSFISRNEKLKRTGDEEAFWNAWQRVELRTDILVRYSVKWILATCWTEMTEAPGCRIVRVFKGEHIRIYRVILAGNGFGPHMDTPGRIDAIQRENDHAPEERDGILRKDATR